MLIYLIKFNIAIMLLYGFYRLLFSRDTFFGYRRAVLLGIYAIALLLPFVDINGWIAANETTQHMATVYAEVMLPEVVITASKVHLSWMTIVWVTYIGGIVVLSTRFLTQLLTICRLASRSKATRIEGKKVHVINENGSPFSFFHWIFVNPNAQEQGQLHEVLVHEQAHVDQNHSIDAVLAELFTIICWFNPFIWLLKREIRINLEFLADRHVIEEGSNPKTYQYHLLGLAYHQNVATISNNFNVLPLKKRIQMMNKRRTKSIGKAKYLLSIPLVAALLVVSNIESVARSIVSEPQVTQKTVTPVRKKVAVRKKHVNAVKRLKTAENTTQKQNQLKDIISEDGVYEVVEQMPEFPGGVTSLMSYLNTNTKYPAKALENGIQGTVVVQFVVDKDGSIIAPKIVRSVDPSLDEEALRVVKSMPKWKPGKQNGKNVKVKYNIPASFKLS